MQQPVTLQYRFQGWGGLKCSNAYICVSLRILIRSREKRGGGDWRERGRCVHYVTYVQNLAQIFNIDWVKSEDEDIYLLLILNENVNSDKNYCWAKIGKR